MNNLSTVHVFQSLGEGEKGRRGEGEKREKEEEEGKRLLEEECCWVRFCLWHVCKSVEVFIQYCCRGC